jgi:hypothetical protein
LPAQIFSGRRTEEDPDFDAMEGLVTHMVEGGHCGNVVVWTKLASAYAAHGTLDVCDQVAAEQPYPFPRFFSGAAKKA